MQEKIDVIARTFGAKTGHIKTSPCSGKWRGTSDISICFDNDARIFIGNLRTPEAKKAKIQNEYVNYTVTRYNPEIVSLTKETALRALRKREERDNAIAAEKGLKPYTVLNVELCEGINGKESEYIGWYYVTIAVDGKIHAHLETGLNHDISFGKVSEGITRDKYFTAVVLKGMDVDYVFNNVGFSTASRMYSLPLSDAARERAEMMLAQQTSELDIQPSIPMKPAQEIASDVNGKRDPLAPAYKVGDTVYLDNTAFTITEVGLHDVQLQDPTQTYPIFRSESKENFEKLLHRDPQNLPITDYLPYNAIDPLDDGGDLRDALTSEGGLLDAGAKEEVSEWLRNGDGNSTIARALEEQFDGQSDTMTLETGETADYSVTENTFMLNLLDKSHTVRMYDLRTVAGVLRAMYQQELGGFSHESAQESPVHPTYTAKTEVVYPVEKNHLPFDVAVQTLHFDEPERKTPQNFHITDDNLGVGGAKAKYQMNMAAIKALHEIENENRPATPEEQATLSKYVGWGALADAFDKSKPAWSNEYKELQTILTPEEYASARASTLNAHYTCPTVIKAMYQALENMGFKGGNILEPSCGVGNFFGLLPESMAKSKLYGVELDGTLGEHIRLADKFAIIVQDFQSTEQVISGILGESPLIHFVVDQAEFSGEIVIEPVEFLLGGLDRII